VGDAAVRALLPGVLAGLARGAGPDRRGAATMVAAALARSARLADAVVNGESSAFCFLFAERPSLSLARALRKKKLHAEEETNSSIISSLP
jgi:hypothetical protein